MVSRKLLWAPAALPLLASATTPPTYSGYTLEWNSDFAGAAGTLPDTSLWNIITGDLNVNDELETYTSSNANIQRSGGGTLQLIPVESASGAWTSGRVESVYTLTPTPAAITRVEALIGFGANAAADKYGLWPAFWMLGESFRTGAAAWPACGELDVMETVDGALTGYGTAHCGTEPGGVCDETTGLQAAVALPDQEAHTWRLEWDRTPASWEDETINWSLDGVVFHTITGAGIGDEGVWTALAHDPFYFILDMAVGGDWPGNPNDETLGGAGSMMEVHYVAHYVS